MRTFKCLIPIIGWLLLARGFIAWVPFPWSVFPIVGTSIPLVLVPIYELRKGKDSSTGLSDRIKSQIPSSGVPDLEEILNKHSKKEGPNQEEEGSIYKPETVIKDKKTSSRKEKSIINEGGKRKKFKTRY